MVKMDKVVENDYVIVLFYEGMRHRPSMNWLLQAYRTLDRRYKKNLKYLFIVKPTMWHTLLMKFVGFFISKKFYQKIVHINNMADLGRYMNLSTLPSHLIDKEIRNLIATPSPDLAGGRFFGVSAEEVAEETTVEEATEEVAVEEIAEETTETEVAEEVAAEESTETEATEETTEEVAVEEVAEEATEETAVEEVAVEETAEESTETEATEETTETEATEETTETEATEETTETEATEIEETETEETEATETEETEIAEESSETTSEAVTKKPAAKNNTKARRGNAGRNRRR
ncbi:hypothetical protein H696_01846 [Fonticula alba]|uniref:CRAL-TRIO domain-containing protein n=1 Tax=Fonticula alba TaxID=691883 RepID=A0A058Z9A9_FONAL|nr:hypothetical protein H696_01846 [Fonticula alba]KCV70899.1 hypothetical protein H696_01846 [Fonticula alba]|eukprot:XP_009494022.1 hypothetical protein H696_01846 [Fonticula alba]